MTSRKPTMIDLERENRELRAALEEIDELIFRDAQTHPVAFFAAVSKIIKKVLGV